MKMTKFNFANIRSYDGSQNNGFEELVCQLAHLEAPENDAVFYRKEGAGGDAGVEAFWKLKNDEEHCWQAKYFLNEMTDSRWQQINESFLTAYKKHPKLTKFVVCLPLDRTDSRKKGRGGKIVVSVLDEWLGYVEQWQKKAQADGRQIEFDFWGKHEIVMRLMNDDPVYSGRALYWFNEPVLQLETFQQIANQARENLGERYTPDLHVELPIAEKLSGLCFEEKLQNVVRGHLVKVIETTDRLLRTAKEEKGFQPTIGFSDFEMKSNQYLSEIRANIERQDFVKFLSDCLSKYKELFDFIRQLFDDSIVQQISDNNKDYLRLLDGDYTRALSDCIRYLSGDTVKAAISKAVLVVGEAGSGKSHLLCDTVLSRLDDQRPTLFLLGQHYGGGSPMTFIRESLDLAGYTNGQILGALDAAGEANKTNTVLVVDAINEGGYREEWQDQLHRFLLELKKYPHIAVVLSCRTTYVDYLIPEMISSECLVQLEHQGFRGYEQKAASQYLSRQGIAKPSAPILAPEFSNPLFLKICSQALKQQGLSEFPKGMRGISALFEFFMQNIEKIIARKKRYRASEKIVHKALMEFAQKLFPDYLYGVPMGDARKFFNDLDPTANVVPSLFDELLDEGVLAEDIEYDVDGSGAPVVRFTYERFSDHFIALSMLKDATLETISHIVEEGHVLGHFIKAKTGYACQGILEQLAIIMAERYSIEFVDVFSKSQIVSVDLAERVFFETILWRTADSISDRTLEILNAANKDWDPHARRILTILKISTEPDHPWNAELLHRNLMQKAMSERDHFWSIMIALSDSEGDDYESESIVRTLIDWATFGEICNINTERVRLCSIVLIWFLTCPNRKVRDQSTKAIVKLLSAHPELLPELLQKFDDVDDLYLRERLYAAAYGVVLLSNDTEIVKLISATTYDLIFKDGNPPVHLLLRDYARGILEYAQKRNLLDDRIEPNNFLPPYKSPWPIDNPTEDEISNLAGGDEYSAIKSSLMGFPGDFGNYTMGCIHNWSATPITEAEPKSGLDLQKDFARSLPEGLRDRYLSYLEPESKGDGAHTDFKWQLNRLVATSSDNAKSGKKDTLLEEIDQVLTKEQKEEFRWLKGLNKDRPGEFSRKWAQRWVCKRAYELGWKSDLFEEFEKRCPRGRGGSSDGTRLERVGKKYQWIAFHELMAHLADNLHWIDRRYSDVPDDTVYKGPWQPRVRDIDPSIFIRKKGNEHDDIMSPKNAWWQPFSFSFPDSQDFEERNCFVWDREQVPDFKSLLCVNSPETNQEFLVLKGFWSENQKGQDTDDDPKLDGWFRINSLIVPKNKTEDLIKSLKGQYLTDPHTVSVPSSDFHGFYGEHPWHPIFSDHIDWSKKTIDYKTGVAVDAHVPIFEYEWERGDPDYSINETLSIYCPSNLLINDLGLTAVSSRLGAWETSQGHLGFLDPSVTETGPSYALIDRLIFLEWLDQNDLQVVWLIGGEKQMFTYRRHEFHGRLNYSGIYTVEDGQVQGKLWFEDERPQ